MKTGTFRRARPAPPLVEVTVDGRPLALPEGEMLAAALLVEGIAAFGRSVREGAPRGPLCLMGSCFQCAVEVDGAPQVRACRTAVRRGMRIALKTPGDPGPGNHESSTREPSPSIACDRPLRSAPSPAQRL